MKIPAPQIRKSVRSLKFGESFFVTTKKQYATGINEADLCGFQCRILSAVKLDGTKDIHGYLIVRTT